MTRRWIVRPLAQADLDDAATWYEGQQSGLGSRFLDAVDHVFGYLNAPRAMGKSLMADPQRAPLVATECSKRTGYGST